MSETVQQRIPEGIDDELYTGVQMRQIHSRGTLNSPEPCHIPEKRDYKPDPENQQDVLPSLGSVFITRVPSGRSECMPDTRTGEHDKRRTQ